MLLVDSLIFMRADSILVLISVVIGATFSLYCTFSTMIVVVGPSSSSASADSAGGGLGIGNFGVGFSTVVTCCAMYRSRFILRVGTGVSGRANWSKSMSRGAASGGGSLGGTTTGSLLSCFLRGIGVGLAGSGGVDWPFSTVTILSMVVAVCTSVALMEPSDGTSSVLVVRTIFSTVSAVGCTMTVSLGTLSAARTSCTISRSIADTVVGISALSALLLTSHDCRTSALVSVCWTCGLS
uniref:Putative secreted peptide n=1 Tax=Anopheles braziliensis TaxID=58242 RepID=A0A2M3ZPH5_9DIPT